MDNNNWQYYTPYEEPGQRQEEPKKKKKKNFGVTLGKCVAIALVFGLVSGIVFHGTGYLFQLADNTVNSETAQKSGGKKGDDQLITTSTASGTKAVVTDVSDVVDNVMPAIVSITNISVQEYTLWFGQTYSEETPSAGSGIIVAQSDNYLYIATNNHVVTNATTLTVSFVDDQAVPAEIKGVDPNRDLAVISVPMDSIPAETLSRIKIATLGDSDSVRVGEPAIAIGNAMGYGQSVTLGIISALDREVTVTDYYNNSITNSLIQTDAAINPGNSGGALLNLNGEVIGINSVKYTNTSVEGMGYAIPISTAEPIINDLITKEVVSEEESGFLGVYGVNVSEEVSEVYNMPRGLYVTVVEENSAAEQAGIRYGDIIVKFDGYEISGMDELVDRMQYYAAGDTVDIVIMSAGPGDYEEHTISVTLGKKIR